MIPDPKARAVWLSFWWVAFYLAFFVGWLIHPEMLYAQLDGRYAEWTIVSRAQWTGFWDFMAIETMQGLVTLRMPENPWAHLGSLPLLAEADTTLRHIASYTIYWLEFALATYFLARVIGFTNRVAQLGTQLWLLLMFPPFNHYFGYNLWVSLIPLHVQTIAAGNCLVALFILLGRYKPATNVALAVAILALGFFYYFIAPLRLVSVAPGYFFMVLVTLLFDLSIRNLAWKLGTLALGGALAFGLHVPDFYGALLGHSPRLWQSAEIIIGPVRGRFDLFDSFMCQHGVLCVSRHPVSNVVLYGSVLLAGWVAVRAKAGVAVARPVKIITAGSAIFYLLMLFTYSLRYTAFWPFGYKFPSPVYVYNPLFPIFCLVAALLWVAMFDSLFARASTLISGICGRIGISVGPLSTPAKSWISNSILIIVPIVALSLLWTHFGADWAYNSLVTGQPIVRSLHHAPLENSLIRHLKDRIAIAPGSRFRGYAASYLGSAYGPIGAELETTMVDPGSTKTYIGTIQYLSREHGNSYMFQDLWTFGVPTLEEYGHFVSPGNKRIFSGLLSEWPHRQLISTSLTYRPTARILRGLGVRFLISDTPLQEPGLRLVMKQEAMRRTLSLPEMKKRLNAAGKGVAENSAAGSVDEKNQQAAGTGKLAREAIEAAAIGDTAKLREIQVLKQVVYLHAPEALIAAAANGRLEALKILHQSGADIRARKDAALVAAAAAGQIKIIRYLHRNGVSLANPEALTAAAARGQLEVVRLLHQNGTDIRANRDAALLSAASSGQVEVIRYLHHNGTDIRADDDAALMAAAAAGRVGIIRYLNENGVNVAAKWRQIIDAAPTEAKYGVLEYLVNSAGLFLSGVDFAQHRGFPVYLYELENPNLASYSPVIVSLIAEATAAEKRMRMADFVMDKEAIVTEPLSGPRVPLISSSMRVEGNSLRVVAQSKGKSLLLLPVQFSRCWQITNVDSLGGATRVRAMRANLTQILLEFEGNIDVRLEFALDFGRGTECRQQDIRELQEMRILEGVDEGVNQWPLPPGKVPYSTSSHENGPK